MTDFAITLHAERRRLGLTQQALAAALGVSQPRLAEWETGKHLPASGLAERLVVELAAMQPPVPQTRRCPGCGTEFGIHHPAQRFCTRRCYQAWWQRQR